MILKKKLLLNQEIKEFNVKYKPNKYIYIRIDKLMLEGEDVLVLYIYFINKTEDKGKKATYRMFITEDEYITQNLKEKGKWRTAILENLIRDYYWARDTKIDIDKNSKIMINDYFKEHIKDPIGYINKTQNNLLKHKLQLKYKRITDVIDRKMEIVPSIPDDFEHWAEYEALCESRYIYYKYTRKAEKEGYCTHCKSEIKVLGAKHNEKGRCPNCKSKITYKAMGKVKQKEVDDTYCSLIQKVEDELIIRDFKIYKDYSEDGFLKSSKVYPSNPKMTIYEFNREFINIKTNRVKDYYFSEFRQSGEIRWCESDSNYSFVSDSFYMCREERCLYANNLEEVFHDTEYKYSAIELFATWQPGYRFNINKYLSTYKRANILEYIVKMRLYRLAEDFINSGKDTFKEDAISFSDITGLDKSYIKKLQQLNPSKRELDILIVAKEEYGIKINDEEIRYLANNIYGSYFRNLFDYSKYASITRIINYIEKIDDGKVNKNNLIHDYIDYIINCKKLNYEIDEFILFPKNFKSAHDQAYELVVKKKNKAYDKEIKKLYDENKYLEFEDKKYKTVLPQSAEEIRREGQVLKHCVGSYVDRIAKRQTYVIFIREINDVDKPFYTIEIKNNNLVQVRGEENKDATNEVNKFLDKFKENRLSNALDKIV